MKRNNYFRKVSAFKYEYNCTGYCVEKMANGLWDAYLPSEHGYRLWQSTHHQTRAGATSAIIMEQRALRRKLKTIFHHEPVRSNPTAVFKE